MGVPNTMIGQLLSFGHHHSAENDDDHVFGKRAAPIDAQMWKSKIKQSPLIRKQKRDRYNSDSNPARHAKLAIVVFN